MSGLPKKARKAQPWTRLGRTCKKCGHDAWIYRGESWRCAPCDKVRDRQRWTPEYVRARNLMSRYGLTTEAFDEMLIAQQGCCDICGEQLTGKNDPHVDHCHETNAVRSLLCHHCNRLLGGARDRAELLVAALDYLTRHHPSRFNN